MANTSGTERVPVVGSEFSFPSLPTSTTHSNQQGKGSSTIDPFDKYYTQAQSKKKSRKGSKKGIPIDIWSSPVESASHSTSSNSSTSQYSIALKSQAQASPKLNYVRSTSPSTPSRQERPVKVNIPWLSTGTAASSVYTSFRADAVSLAYQRNELFNRARDAFVAGNKAQAKALSAQGHELNERMHELHRKASEAIFKSRNNGGGGDEVLVDLHGLHPEEGMPFDS